MTVKSLGPGVSGYLDPEDRAWETVAYQAGKPVLDKELNLVQDAEQDAELRFRRRSVPSGFLMEDFLSVRAGTTGLTAIVDYGGVANSIQLPQGMRAHVNGWLVNISSTNSNSRNALTLSASQIGRAHV